MKTVTTKTGKFGETIVIADDDSSRRVHKFMTRAQYEAELMEREASLKRSEYIAAGYAARNEG